MRLNRLNLMEQYIIRHETASLEELTEHFHISINTVRRDLNELLARGSIRKVYGGVSAAANNTPVLFSPHSEPDKQAKAMIGEMAASLVSDGASIFLDSGSTTPAILPYLEKKSGITVVTHSLCALYEASKYPNLKIISLGGIYIPETCSYVGVSTLETLSHISVQTIFLSASGVSLNHGLTNSTYLEAEIKRHVIQRGKRVVLMADYSKFDTSSVVTFYDFENLNTVVTDKKPRTEYLDVMSQNHIQFLCPETYYA